MVMENITGMTVVFIKGISNMVFDMDMELGKIKNNLIKGLIEWIKNKVQEYILGQKDNVIKENLSKIIEMDMVKYTK